jgi:hypothetical protein
MNVVLLIDSLFMTLSKENLVNGIEINQTGLTSQIKTISDGVELVGDVRLFSRLRF